MKRWLMTAAVLGAGTLAGAQGGYDAMRLEEAGLVAGNLSGQLTEISGGVRIVLLSQEPDQPEVPVRAKTITFEYKKGETMPARIKLNGDVYIKHPRGVMQAGAAEWNFETGDMIFTGNPVFSSDQVPEMRASVMKINVETGEFSAEGKVSIPRVDPRQAGASAPAASTDPALLTTEDVTDWRKFMNELKKGAVPDAPASPAKHMVSLLPEEAQKMVQAGDAEQLAKENQKVTGALNKMLGSPAFYSEAAWAGIELPEPAKVLLKKENRAKDETTRMNRLLLHAAYPDLVKAPA